MIMLMGKGIKQCKEWKNQTKKQRSKSNADSLSATGGATNFCLWLLLLCVDRSSLCHGNSSPPPTWLFSSPKGALLGEDYNPSQGADSTITKKVRNIRPKESSQDCDTLTVTYLIRGDVRRHQRKKFGPTNGFRRIKNSLETRPIFSFQKYILEQNKRFLETPATTKRGCAKQFLITFGSLSIDVAHAERQQIHTQIRIAYPKFVTKHWI